MTWYPPLNAPNPTAESLPHITILVDQLPTVDSGLVSSEGPSGLTIDDNQPFPIYGFVDIFWLRSQPERVRPRR